MFECIAHLRAGRENFSVSGLRGGGVAFFCAAAAEARRRPCLLICPTEASAQTLEQDLSLFSGLDIVRYPAFDIPPYTPLSPDPATVAARIATLSTIVTAGQPLVTVASVEALLRRVLPRTVLTSLAELVMAGEETDPGLLAERLTAMGYEHVSLVQSVGDLCVRGGIVDLFPPGFAMPVRLDFFGDTVESIRLFDPISQRSVEQLPEAVFLPASTVLFPEPGSTAAAEMLGRFRRLAEKLDWEPGAAYQIEEKLATGSRFPGIEFLLPLFYREPSLLTDYLHPETLVVHTDYHANGREGRQTWERILANYEEALAAGTVALPPEEIFCTRQDLERALAPFQTVSCREFEEFALEDGANGKSFALRAGNHLLLKQELGLGHGREGLLAPLAEKVRSWQEAGDTVAVACRTQRHAMHLAELFSHHQVAAELHNDTLKPLAVRQDLAASTLHLFDQPLSEGFDLVLDSAGGALHLLSESQLFGRYRIGAGRRSRGRRHERRGETVSFEELRVGDVVVHRDHGLGIYEGIANLELYGTLNDFLQLSYRDGDRLYLPVDRINLIGKYQGLSDKEPKLDKLGGKQWTTAKQKVQEAVWQVAQDLLDLYARRELREGTAFSRPTDLFRELEESFAYDETPGQLKAITDVLDDLTVDRPMDRLVCGDVGYGKTEVAIRAAFKVVEDGFQAAILVPTTVLAEQHAETFRERLQGFPVRVESMSRFRTTAEQKEIAKKLKEGQVDIVIGTHRLLSKDVSFRRLGLLIIDEEHRFGVSHKERIKRLKAEVDVLTLTATPIPRTLQLSLLGIRDLSVISTPPEQRRPIKTFVARYDDLVIKEAVQRELQRGGQVFLVHNRVRSIHEMAARVETLVPSARVSVAHGQMAPKDLEEIMVHFVNRKIDVLVCTTIIESGLDIPNANTIVINRADRMGLAEIYQLRGRVGRGQEQSYAYLLVPSLDNLSKDARNRLRALMDNQELGGGFKLAMSDLQIRGGGNILGVSQSGHIAAVGYDLYLDLLQRTVLDLKRRAAAAGEETVDIEPELNLQLSAFIPERYMADTDQRYIAYRRLAGLDRPEELADLKEEFVDRYGALPAETENLFEVMELKLELKKLRITKLEKGREALVFSFHEKTTVDPARILALMSKAKQTIRFTPDSRLIVTLPAASLASPAALLAHINDVLQALAG